MIDTPGFGDNQMHKSLKKYLTKSCGFIYVVNTANAGGVQRGRVRFSNKQDLSVFIFTFETKFSERYVKAIFGIFGHKK